MCQSTSDQDFLSVEEAAASLKTTPTAILMLLRRGNLIGKEVAGEGWLVDPVSLAKVISARTTDAPLVECRSSCSSKSGGCSSCG